MDSEFILKWHKAERKAKQEGKKLSWHRWLESEQFKCNHDFRPMYNNMNDSICGERCIHCGKAY